MAAKSTKGSGPNRSGKDFWNLRLYVLGETPRSIVALANLKKICEQHLAGRYRIEVVDVRNDEKKASQDRIVAVPTVVRRLPPPIRQVIGDLSRTDEVLVGLEVLPVTAPE
jgi:circadian clock protein KaiB